MADELNENNIELVKFYQKSNELVIMIDENLQQLREGNFDEKLLSGMIISLKNSNKLFADMGFDDILEYGTIALDGLEVFRKNMKKSTPDKIAKDFEGIDAQITDFFSIYDSNIEELSAIIGADIKSIELSEEELEGGDDETREIFKKFCVLSSACILKIEELLENGITFEFVPMLESILTFMSKSAGELGFDDIEDTISSFLKSTLAIHGEISEAQASKLFEGFTSLQSILKENIAEIIQGQGLKSLDDDIALEFSRLDETVGFEDPFKASAMGDLSDEAGDESDEEETGEEVQEEPAGESQESIEENIEVDVINSASEFNVGTLENLESQEESQEVSDELGDEINSVPDSVIESVTDSIGDSIGDGFDKAEAEIISSIQETLKEDEDSTEQPAPKETASGTFAPPMSLPQTQDYLIQVDNIKYASPSQVIEKLGASFMVRQVIKKSGSTFFRASTTSTSIHPQPCVHVIALSQDFNMDEFENVENNDIFSFLSGITFGSNPKGTVKIRDIKSHLLSKCQSSYSLFKDLFKTTDSSFILSSSPAIKLSQQDHLLLLEILSSVVKTAGKVLKISITETADSFDVELFCDAINTDSVANKNMIKKIYGKADSNVISIFKSENMVNCVIDKNTCIPKFFIKRVFHVEKKLLFFDVNDICYLFDNGELRKISSDVKRESLTQDKFSIALIDVFGKTVSVVLPKYEEKALLLKDDGFFLGDKKVELSNLLS